MRVTWVDALRALLTCGLLLILLVVSTAPIQSQAAKKMGFNVTIFESTLDWWFRVSYHITGSVIGLDNKEPVANAMVSVHIGVFGVIHDSIRGATDYSDTDGQFELSGSFFFPIPFLTDYYMSVIAQKAGYDTATYPLLVPILLGELYLFVRVLIVLAVACCLIIIGIRHARRGRIVRDEPRKPRQNLIAQVISISYSKGSPSSTTRGSNWPKMLFLKMDIGLNQPHACIRSSPRFRNLG